MLRKFKLAKKLLQDRKYPYISHGYKRIYNSIVNLNKIIKGNGELLDIGGTGDLEYSRRNYSFKKYTNILCDFEYNYENTNTIDIRNDELLYDDNTFDVVVSHESLEHFWTIKEGGMLSWKGVLNFWNEAYRVLKPNGVFYVTTRNRVCPFALCKALTNQPVQVSFSSIEAEEGGHVTEFSPDDLREIANKTNKFTNNKIYSTNSLSRFHQNETNKEIKNLKRFLKRDFKQEELYDTLNFVSTK